MVVEVVAITIGLQLRVRPRRQLPTPRTTHLKSSAGRTGPISGCSGAEF